MNIKTKLHQCVLFLLLGIGIMAPSHAKEDKNLTTVPYVDINRYMGDWYVIANIPYFAEKNCYGSLESYRLREDGNIDNIFSCHKGSLQGEEKKYTALASIYNKQTNAEWRVRFFWLFSFSYLVLELAPDYSYTVVGHPSKKYVWIMARAKTMDDKTYKGILSRLQAKGWDVSQVTKVPQ